LLQKKVAITAEEAQSIATLLQLTQMSKTSSILKPKLKPTSTSMAAAAAAVDMEDITTDHALMVRWKTMRKVRPIGDGLFGMAKVGVSNRCTIKILVKNRNSDYISKFW